jgi:hypothetical protein
VNLQPQSFFAAVRFAVEIAALAQESFVELVQEQTVEAETVPVVLRPSEYK